MNIVTDYPVALDSPDHIYPWGTANDNTTDIGFINEIESYFQNKKIKMLDIGCSGGQLVIDFHSRGHQSIGIEGSNFSVKSGRANWPKYHNKILFTCDATKPYKIMDGKENVIFDLITAWEVVEHISFDDLEIFFNNIKNHMNKDSIFCASISTEEDIVIIQTGKMKNIHNLRNLLPENRKLAGVHNINTLTREEYNTIINELPGNDKLADSNPDKFIASILHQSVFSKEVWESKILNKYFSIQSLPFKNKVRYGNSFHVLLKIK